MDNKKIYLNKLFHGKVVEILIIWDYNNFKVYQGVNLIFLKILYLKYNIFQNKIIEKIKR